MFSKGIYRTTLTSQAADRLFSNITASIPASFGDASFLATLRALLQKRLPQDAIARLSCNPVYFTALQMESATAAQCMDWLTEGLTRHVNTSDYGVHIVHTSDPNAGEKMFEVLRSNSSAVRRYLEGYARRDDLQVFYARKAKAMFYTNTEQTRTIVFTDKLELKHFHVLQMMIPKYLPNLFANGERVGGELSESGSKQGGLTEREMALLKSLGNKSAVEYETLIEDFAKDLDIRSEIIRLKLAGFETAFERVRAEEVKSELVAYQKDFDHYTSELRSITHKMQEKRYVLAGLESVVCERSGDSELMEYFMCNKNLSIANVMGTAIEFVVHGYADVYDVEAFEQYASNRGGFLYKKLNPAITKVQMEKLYWAIFGENKYKLRICAAYTADIRNGLNPRQYYTFPAESNTYLPNPHIHSFGCIGTYAARFQEYMGKRDYVGAIEQAVVSARNLNFYDATVMTIFAESLSKTNITCIERVDGMLLTPLEAVREIERLEREAANGRMTIEEQAAPINTGTEREDTDVCQDQ